MKYISGQFALNLKCNLNTSGDWHYSSLNWDNLKLNESGESIFKDYGIEKDKYVDVLKGTYNVANHIRAILDLLYERKFDLISNFNKQTARSLPLQRAKYVSGEMNCVKGLLF